MQDGSCARKPPYQAARRNQGGGGGADDPSEAFIGEQIDKLDEDILDLGERKGLVDVNDLYRDYACYHWLFDR